MPQTLHSSFQQEYFIEQENPKTAPVKIQVRGQLNHNQAVQKDDLLLEDPGGEEEECANLMIYLFQSLYAAMAYV